MMKLLVSALLAANAHALEPPYVFIGIDKDVSSHSIFCNYRSEASNLGIGQTLYSTRRVEVNAQWTHHSCTTEYRDREVYNGLGINARVYLWER